MRESVCYFVLFFIFFFYKKAASVLHAVNVFIRLTYLNRSPEEQFALLSLLSL